ncbi:hypothetical protein [Bradyrhizobium septentrionale]|uniref:Uncharacterized protein n=1 Tax=Bradyrhizobium septentrionale TaxID=1404411 RepID=A0A973VW52_9BRAD|nr:hypothetical protein [Bradyrhizobium septentrionale]UGY19955.1 hypothetical protein HAP48_0022270 [Bradyrhizobium septentrionale]UGY28742.1 hypothetical protein HU675_0019285 [Bradyrhizobium septentrionale]
MRNTKARGYLIETSRMPLMRGLRLAFVAAGIGLVMTAGPVRAGDDDDDGDDGLTFEERIVDNLMTGLGAKSAASKGIDYRERSPLVVPPKLDLPPPASAAQVNAPNWPKDPDIARRKAAIAARKKEVKKESWESAMPLTQAEIEAGRKQQTATDGKREPLEPGGNTNPALSPSQLGYTGGLLGMFKGNSSESKPFKGEPTRDSLTEPPPGYQTPSSGFAYGTGPMQPVAKEGQYDVMSGKPVQ